MLIFAYTNTRAIFLFKTGCFCHSSGPKQVVYFSVNFIANCKTETNVRKYRVICNNIEANKWVINSSQTT